ncbi:hypothetical protein BC827DRAFT_960669 [Russula dissimulans]|nr:hypothetical protein BC827DRAFT_960669 [Russula dissimulans]
MVSHPHSRFDLVFNSALDAYTKRTRQYLPSHPLLSRLQSCDSAEAVLAVLREQIPTFRYSDDTFSMWLIPTVNVLHAFSANLGEGVGLVFSPAKLIFAGIGILLSAAKDVGSSQDKLVDLLNRIGYFFRRLEIYIEIPPTPAMTDILVEIMVEVLSILAMATNELKRGQLSTLPLVWPFCCWLRFF